MTARITHASINDLDERLKALDRKLGDELARLRGGAGERTLEPHQGTPARDRKLHTRCPGCSRARERN